VASATPRTTPLTMISAAVAGDDLQSVAGSASEFLERPVAISLPALGAPVVRPLHAAQPEALQELVVHTAAMLRGETPERGGLIADSVPIRIGDELVGLVAALGPGSPHPDQRAWLEATAAAAAVTSLMRTSRNGDLTASRRAFLLALAAQAPVDLDALLGQAHRLGVDLSAGAVALCARGAEEISELPSHPGALLGDVGHGRVLGLLPASAEASPGTLLAELAALGMAVSVSAPRREPAALHEALHEAELMLELTSRPETLLAGQEETYRLLIGVLLRNPTELDQLREQTISSLEKYDSEHDAELLATLQTFLAHHGSTTDTAEAMQLHRHTVGYRLARVQEVSGLSPYESGGRERLSLGLKAHQILDADRRRAHED
jgi:hypothetical protein